jgi:hypothetical protein
MNLLEGIQRDLFPSFAFLGPYLIGVASLYRHSINDRNPTLLVVEERGD